jgi:hypothetical protein
VNQPSGVDAFGDEERMEFGDHGRAGGGEEPFAELEQFGGQGSAGRGGQRDRLAVRRSSRAHLLPPFGVRRRLSGAVAGGEGVGETVGAGAGFDDVPGEGQPVDDRRAEPRVGDGLRPAGERLVARDGQTGGLLAFGEDLSRTAYSSSLCLVKNELTCDNRHVRKG